MTSLTKPEYQTYQRYVSSFVLAKGLKYGSLEKWLPTAAAEYAIAQVLADRKAICVKP